MASLIDIGHPPRRRSPHLWYPLRVTPGRTQVEHI